MLDGCEFVIDSRPSNSSSEGKFMGK